MTKVIRIDAHGGPEVLRAEDVEVGRPGPGEVRLRHTAIGVNFLDVYMRKGDYPGVPPLPFIPGNEGAGEVVEIGENVTEFKPGDRGAYCTSIGAYAQERLIASSQLIKLPDTISDETAAAMMLKGLTAQYLIRQTFPIKAGHTILVHAAAGGVGLILCQWAKALGATVIGTAGSPQKAELAKTAGADEVILYRSEDWVARVREITQGKLCDVVYDGVGKDTFPGSLDCIRPLGLFVSFGSASGQIESFNIGLLGRKGSLFATRPTLLTYASTREKLVAMANDLFDVVTSGKVRIPINARFPLAEAAKAHQALESRQTTGTTILIP